MVVISLAFVAATTLLALSKSSHHPRMAPQQRKKLKISASSSSSSSDVVDTRPTVRCLDDSPAPLKPQDAAQQLQQLTNAMNERAGKSFTEDEQLLVSHSLQNVCAPPLTWDEANLRQWLTNAAHFSHKDWGRTETNAAQLDRLLLPNGMDGNAQQMFERILLDGNWKGAAAHAAQRDGDVKPWAVLVTGVNGIRKTTSMYEPWFSKLLGEALQSPPAADSKDDNPAGALAGLPDGSNSFFRQLDHMIATLCNEDFGALYRLTRDSMSSDASAAAGPSKAVIQNYSDYKAAIFSRYRTLSELLGVVLLSEAQKIKLNCMLETSGRDVAMFHYVDHFFPADSYRKLALHFTINDIEYAKESVDQRMVQEIETGVAALEQRDVFAIIRANAGGPYGSEVLEGVQADSDRVWKEEVLSGKVGQDWYKATIQINAHTTEPWTAQAVRPDGSLGTEFTFGPRK